MLMAIRVNIAIGEVKGMKEQTFIRIVSTDPSANENITTKNPAINSNVIGRGKGSSKRMAEQQAAKMALGYFGLDYGEEQ